MASIYNLIEGNLNDLRLHTELLEACDWDEALLEEFSSHLQLAFHYITEKKVDYAAGLILLKEILELNDWSDLHYNIIVKIMELHVAEIKQFMIKGNEQ